MAGSALAIEGVMPNPLCYASVILSLAVVVGESLSYFKTQNIFCCVNENSTTFLYNLNRGDKKTEGEKKVFFFKVYNYKDLVFVLVFSLSNE